MRTNRSEPGAPVTEPSTVRGPLRWAFAAGDLVAERFVIRRPVGRGGMGEVYEAVDQELQERVAIKTILAAHLDDGSLRRFRREIHLARRISHPSVSRVHDVFAIERKLATYYFSVWSSSTVTRSDSVWHKRRRSPAIRFVRSGGRSHQRWSPYMPPALFTAT
jgi:serine/threonine protein kinase